jgi:hypothetical protein
MVHHADSELERDGRGRDAEWYVIVIVGFEHDELHIWRRRWAVYERVGHVQDVSAVERTRRGRLGDDSTVFGVSTAIETEGDLGHESQQGKFSIEHRRRVCT